MQAVGLISEETAKKINEFRESFNTSFQKWLVGSSGSALFNRLFGAKGSE